MAHNRLKGKNLISSPDFVKNVFTNLGLDKLDVC
jgi:hypothetical protein